MKNCRLKSPGNASVTPPSGKVWAAFVAPSTDFVIYLVMLELTEIQPLGDDRYKVLTLV